MATEDRKLNDVDVEQSGEQETAFSDESETVKFLPDESKIDNKKTPAESEKGHHHSSEFYGLSREELEQYAQDPKWVKIRWILFAIFVVGWALMLVIAIVIVVVTPKCPPTPSLKWYQDGVAYKVKTAMFQDSNEDGFGDLNGLKSRLEHFKDLSVESVWLVDVLDSDNLEQPKPELGSMEDFESLASTFKKKGIRVVIDFDLRVLDQSLNSSHQQIDEMVRKWGTAGAEGFLMSLPDQTAESVYADVTMRLQGILDEEFNKKDDRDRVIISRDGLKVDDLADVRAVVYEPKANCTGLDSVECSKAELNTLGDANLDVPWKILQIKYEIGSPVCNLAFRLTMPGTPNVLYGDEIGLVGSVYSRGYMKWDDTPSSGFTTKQGWTIPSSQADVQSVLAQRAEGFTDVSLYSMFKMITSLRTDEPSLKWGSFKLLEFGEDVVVYTREAEGFDPIVVALNPYDGKAGSLVYGEYTHAEVLVVSGVDLNVGDTVDLSAVYLPKNGVLIARMSNPNAKKSIF